MFTLKNNALSVEVLDPVADQNCFGTRYCTGGYIFQVSDARRGPLLSGPTYPKDFNWFDGQGIPDAFNRGPLIDPTATDSIALIIGIGLCNLAADTVVEFCRWEVAQSSTDIKMKTAQSFQHFGLELTRTVSLYGRTVRSHIVLKNVGKASLPLRWFPHPFYPQPTSDELCRFNIPFTLAENPNYEIAASGYIQRKGWPWEAGYFQALEHDAQTNLVIQQKHPVLGLVSATCSYIPDFFPIWGNQHTFSWEPYLERTVFMGQTLAWWIDYDF